MAKTVWELITENPQLADRVRESIRITTFGREDQFTEAAKSEMLIAYFRGYRDAREELGF